MKTAITALFAIGSIGFLSACQTTDRSSILLEPYTCGNVQRLHTIDGIFLASQPSPADFEQASEGGIRTVVNLRQNSELDWDEGEVVTALGMNYAHLPFSRPGELTDDIFDRARDLFNNAERPLLVHCGSANRVGALWLAHRVLDGNLPVEAAQAEAAVVGLRSSAYEARALAYIESRN